MLRPTIDGEVTNYFEWVGAGELDIVESSGSMHQVAPMPKRMVTAIRFGFDADALFVRVDLARRAADLLADKGELRLTFFSPPGHRVSFRREGSEHRLTVQERRPGDGWESREGSTSRGAAGHIVELAVSFADLGAKPGQTLSLSIGLYQDGQALEQYPPHHPLDVTVPAADFAARNWSV